MALEGDDWKYGNKPTATAHNMRTFRMLESRVLLAVVNYDGLLDTHVVDVSPCGEYTQLMMRGGFMNTGHWVRTADCTILSVLQVRPPVAKTQQMKNTKLTKSMLDDIYDSMMKGKQDDTE